MSLQVNFTGSNNTIQTQGFDNKKTSNESTINTAAQRSFQQMADTRQGNDGCCCCKVFCFPCWGVAKLIEWLFKCLFPCCFSRMSDSNSERTTELMSQRHTTTQHSSQTYTTPQDAKSNQSPQKWDVLFQSLEGMGEQRK